MALTPTPAPVAPQPVDADARRREAMRKAAMELAREDLEKDRNIAANVGSGINKTLIAIPGTVTDFGNALLSHLGMGQPLPGTADIERYAGKIGLVNVGLPENRAEKFGQVMATAVPGVGLVGTAAKTKALTDLTTRTGRTLEPILSSFRAAPRRFAGAEVLASTGAAIGGEIGHRMEGEQSIPGLNEIIGQVIGGIAGPQAISAAVKGVTMSPILGVVAKVGKQFTKPGRTASAAALVQRGLGSDAGLAVQAERQADLLPGEKLTFGARAGSEKLIALEKAVATKRPELAELMAGNEAETNRAVHDALKSAGSIDDTVAYFEARKLRAIKAMDARMAAAIARTDEAIAKLRPDAGRADTSKILSRELEDAVRDGRTQETQIWDALDGKAKMMMPNADQTYREIVGEDTQLPGFVHKAFQKMAAEEAGEPRLLVPGAKRGEFVEQPAKLVNPVKNFEDVRQLRSQMWRYQKQMRNSGNAETAYVLQRLMNSLVKDIEQANLGPEFSAATSYSHKFNDTFTRGPVGEMLRFSPRGGRAVDPFLMSEEILTGSAPETALAVGKVREAIAFKRDPNGDNLEVALAENMRSRLFKGTGEFDMTAAKSLLEKKGELIDRFPDLKKDIQAALSSDAARKKLQARMEQVTDVGLTDKRRSALALVLDGHPETRLAGIMTSPKRPELLSKAVRAARSDPRALAGLQDGYQQQLMKHATSARADALGNKMFAAQQMRNYFNATKKDLVSSGLYKPEDLERLDRVIRTAERLEKQVLVNPRQAQIAMQNANMLEDFVLRVIGANIGAEAGGSLGAGLVAARAGSEVVRKIATVLPFDKVLNLLSEAVRDRNLMQDLLTRPTSFSRQKESLKRLNAWVMALDPTTVFEEEQTQ